MHRPSRRAILRALMADQGGQEYSRTNTDAYTNCISGHMQLVTCQHIHFICT